MSSAFPIVKLAAHVAASAGVSKVIGDVVRNNVNIVTTADAVKVWTGTFVIGALVVEAASKSIDARFTEVTSWYENRKTAEETVELSTE